MTARSDSELAPRPGSAAWWGARASRPRRASSLTAERIAAAARAYLTILHYTIGCALMEQRLAFVDADTRQANSELFAGLPAEEYPATRRLANELTNTTINDEFEVGLHALIAGLQGAPDR